MAVCHLTGGSPTRHRFDAQYLARGHGTGCNAQAWRTGYGAQDLWNHKFRSLNLETYNTAVSQHTFDGSKVSVNKHYGSLRPDACFKTEGHKQLQTMCLQVKGHTSLKMSAARCSFRTCVGREFNIDPNILTNIKETQCNLNKTHH